MSDELFEHAANFEQGEVTGNVRIGRFEMQYEELFSDAIEDGVITTEEREHLDQAAHSMGLDAERVAQLERALAAAYEVRHRVAVVDVTAPEPPPASTASAEARAQVLARRVRELEAHVAELEVELEEARAHVSVDVDFSDLTTAEAAPDDPDELFRRVRHDPRDAKSLESLFRLAEPADPDRALRLAQALAFIGAPTDASARFAAAHTQEGLIRPTSSVSPELWRRLLYHPDQEVVTGEIFSVIVSSVLLGRVATLRQQNQLPKLAADRLQDPRTSTVQAVRCFAWGASILGMAPPPLYADPQFDGTAEMVAGVPPACRLGKKALSGRQPAELAFLAGRWLTSFREEHFVRLLFPSIPDLEDIFLAALTIGQPTLPLGADVKARVTPLARAIEPILEPVLVDRLRGHFMRFVEDGGRTNLQRWATACDLTGCRAGLLLSGDLAASARMIEVEASRACEASRGESAGEREGAAPPRTTNAEGGAEARARIDDLIVFLVSDRCGHLRRQLGIAVG